MYDAVGKLNLDKSLCNKFTIFSDVVSNTVIKYGEFVIYNPRVDKLKYDEQFCDYEEIYLYVKRKTNEYIDKIVKYKN